MSKHYKNNSKKAKPKQPVKTSQFEKHLSFVATLIVFIVLIVGILAQVLTTFFHLKN